MKIFSHFSLWGLLGLLFLASCMGPQASFTPTRYILPSVPGGRICLAECRSMFNQCAKGCQLEKRNCTAKMQEQAVKDYEKYARERLIAKEPVELRASDFERPEKCRRPLCRQRCRVTYRDCFTGCGGQIIPGTEPSRLPFEWGEEP